MPGATSRKSLSYVTQKKTHLELPRSPLLKYLNIGCEFAMGYEQNDSNGWCNEYSRQSKKRASIAFAKSPHGKYCPAHQQFLYDVLYCYVSCIMYAVCLQTFISLSRQARKISEGSLMSSNSESVMTTSKSIPVSRHRLYLSSPSFTRLRL